MSFVREIWDTFWVVAFNLLWTMIYGLVTFYLIENVVKFDTGLTVEDFLVSWGLIWYGSILVVKNYLRNYKDNY